MRKISEMYQQSGGTVWSKNCSECLHYARKKKNSICKNYPGDVPWDGNYVACKFFEDQSDIDDDPQIDIFDLLNN